MPYSRPAKTQAVAVDAAFPVLSRMSPVPPGYVQQINTVWQVLVEARLSIADPLQSEITQSGFIHAANVAKTFISRASSAIQLWQ